MSDADLTASYQLIAERLEEHIHEPGSVERVDQLLGTRRIEVRERFRRNYQKGVALLEKLPHSGELVHGGERIAERVRQVLRMILPGFKIW